MTNRHFWLVVGMFALGVVLHYPQQILGTESSSLLSSLGLTRHAVERVLLLLPISYVGLVFGLKAGLVSLGVALAIMLPRAIWLSSAPTDALFESGGVIVIGGLVNLWFYFHRRDIARRKSAEGMLTKIIDGSSIPAFVLDKQHRVTHWNTALEALSAVKKGKIIGTSEQWRAFYAARRPVMADLIVDGATPTRIAAHYRGKYKKSSLIEGAYEAEDWFPILGGSGRWLHFTASPIKNESGEIIGAIETLEDVTERENAEKGLRNHLQEITRAQEEERRRIARELHDETAQDLVIILRQVDELMAGADKLSPESSALLDELRLKTKEILDGVHRFSQDLRPSVLDDLGLIPALEWLAADLTRHFVIAVEMKVLGSVRRLLPEIELVVFRIAQEALRNVWKHSGATKARVTLKFGDDKAVLTVEDEGKGFEMPGKMDDLTVAGKLGLTGMRERAQLIGGKLSLQSEPGKGTTVTLEFPLWANLWLWS
ncbi:MAG TPA: ATP-binding protein [Dehalococcoidales bacterium]|nr:ATP-binding protein [Dehalococcoidales bacterium]